MSSLKTKDRSGLDGALRAIDGLARAMAMTANDNASEKEEQQDQKKKAQQTKKQQTKESKKSGNGLMSNRALKKHLKYIVPEMRLALIKESGLKPQTITCADDLDRFIEPMKHYSEEHFVSFHLNTKFQVIGYQIISRGTINASLVHPREVFKAALLANSYALIVAHNHPGGSLEPSREDISTTKTLIEAGEILGVQVIDHLIVSSNGSQSIRESSPNLWN